MNPRYTLCALLLIGVSMPGAGDAAESWTTRSPAGEVVAIVTLDSERSPSLSYRIEAADGAAVLDESPLGIEREDQQFVDGLSLVTADPPQDISDDYTMLRGKRSDCTHRSVERRLRLVNGDGARFDLVLRVADDGVAFRYEFPESDDAESKDLTCVVTGEATGFRPAADAKAWIQPLTEPSIWGPSYEDYYRNGERRESLAAAESRWCFPALFHVETADRWVLLTEAGLNATYAGCGLSLFEGDPVYRVRLPEPGEGIGVGAVRPESMLPWKTPWRVVIVGGLDTIVESTLVTDLSPPSTVEGAAEWVRPGRVSWSWWSDNDSPQDFDSLTKFVDFAAELGWEYSLVDANWTLMRGGDIEQLADYAAERGVKLLLWYNSGGDHNSVFEKPRGCMNDRRVRRHEFELLRGWGVAGVKVDFFHSDKQDRMAQYVGILEDAAEYGLMVNLHGCTIPRGWSRTYPHLMTMEAVRGAESYMFIDDFPTHAATQSTILPFTRNAIGPMDYTPVTWTPRDYPSRTTMAHELSLSVLFESGWQHYADSADAYRAAPEPVREWLRTTPAAWDETRYLSGTPGEWVALARRSGDAWYVAITNNDTARTVTVDLKPLGVDSGRLATIVDDGAGSVLAETIGSVSESASFELAPHGGAVGRITQ